MATKGRLSGLGGARKAFDLQAFLPNRPGQQCPGHCPEQSPPPAILERPAAPVQEGGAGLGAPLDIRQVAALIGCSPWTVRQSLIPKGLPFFRFAASGKLIFYTKQVVRWIETKQKGGRSS